MSAVPLVQMLSWFAFPHTLTLLPTKVLTTLPVSVRRAQSSFFQDQGRRYQSVLSKTRLELIALVPHQVFVLLL
jgi:hypothetical protein